MSGTALSVRRPAPSAIVALVALALLARLAVSAGWMPARTASGFVLTLCPGDTIAQPKQDHGMAGMHHMAAGTPADDDGSDKPQPCAFSVVFAATIALPAVPVVGVPLVPVPLTDRRRPEMSVGRGLAAPPPPSRAPPSLPA